MLMMNRITFHAHLIVGIFMQRRIRRRGVDEGGDESIFFRSNRELNAAD